MSSLPQEGTIKPKVKRFVFWLQDHLVPLALIWHVNYGRWPDEKESPDFRWVDNYVLGRAIMFLCGICLHRCTLLMYLQCVLALPMELFLVWPSQYRLCSELLMILTSLGFSLLGLWALLDIATKYVKVIFELSEPGASKDVDFARNAILTALNLLTVILIYGIIYSTMDLCWRGSFGTACNGNRSTMSVWDAFSLSWAIMFTANCVVEPCTVVAQGCVHTQHVLWFLLIAVFLALIVNNLTRERPAA